MMDDILAKIDRLDSIEEVEGFRDGLRLQGIQMTDEIMVAITQRIIAITARSKSGMVAPRPRRTHMNGDGS